MQDGYRSKLREWVKVIVSVVVALAVTVTTAQAHALCKFQGGCERDADCGHGFECVHGEGSELGLNYGASCGNGYCESSETAANCEADCSVHSYCRPASCKAHGDADCATERGCRCSNVLQDDLSDAATCTRGMQFCCDSDDDCVRNAHCVIAIDEALASSQGAAGAAGAAAGGPTFVEKLDNIGYCASGDSTQLLTAVASASSGATSGSGGTASMASDPRGTMADSSSASNSSGCSVGTGQPAGPLALLMVTVAGLVQCGALGTGGSSGDSSASGRGAAREIHL